MRYSFKDIEGRQHTLDVPRSYLSDLLCVFGLTVEEACEMYAVDNGYTVADTLAIKDDGLDAVEEDIMQELFTAVCRLNMGQEVENVELSHSGRMISFSLGGDAYTVELSKDNEAK